MNFLLSHLTLAASLFATSTIAALLIGDLGIAAASGSVWAAAFAMTYFHYAKRYLT